MSHSLNRTLACAVALLSLTGVAFAQPAQPTNVTALHRSGQTFVTWTENAAITGESYRIYRANAPITASTLPTDPIFEVTEDSSRFFADLHQGSPRFFSRLVVPNQNLLGPGEGLLVWTLDASDLPSGSGTHYYAVTTFHQGVENTADFTANGSNGVAESIAAPEHVLGKRDSSGRGHVFIQYMNLHEWNATFHAPNPTNNFYGLTNPAGAPQYAYTYSVREPINGPGPFPMVIDLHAFGGQAAGSTASLPVLAPFTTPIEVKPVDPGNTWWFGFEATTDYRTGKPTGATGEVVRNFTEHRILRMIHDLCNDPKIGPRIDKNRIYVTGFSMGASGTLSLAMRYPMLFAAAFADKPVSDYTLMMNDFFRSHNEALWGSLNAGVPVHLLPSPSTWGCHLPSRANGTNVWKWQNHVLQIGMRRRDEIVPIGINHGTRDLVLLWPNQGQPLYPAINASDRCYGAVTTNQVHLSSPLGMPPTLGPALLLPFQNYKIVRDETVPGIANSTLDVNQPTSVSHNQEIEWNASWGAQWHQPPVDLVGTWEISLRASASVGIDVTPRRTQAFHVEPGAAYSWSNFDIANNAVIGSGTVIGDIDGLVTVRNLRVLTGGNRLSITKTNPYTLTVSSPLQTGTNGTLTLANATPNSAHAVLATLAGIDVHLEPILNFGTVQVRLCNPSIFAPLMASVAGNATHTFPVIDSTLGATVWFQSVEVPSLRTTNVVKRIVE